MLWIFEIKFIIQLCFVYICRIVIKCIVTKLVHALLTIRQVRSVLDKLYSFLCIITNPTRSGGDSKNEIPKRYFDRLATERTQMNVNNDEQHEEDTEDNYDIWMFNQILRYQTDIRPLSDRYWTDIRPLTDRNQINTTNKTNQIYHKVILLILFK